MDASSASPGCRRGVTGGWLGSFVVVLGVWPRGMMRLRQGLAVAAMALVMGSLTAGCGGSGPVGGAIKTAISSLAPTRTAIPSRSASIAPPAPTTEAPARIIAEGAG